MDQRPKFIFTDVFGDDRYTGNQLATFLNCGALVPDEMQKIAREINFSETTFVTSDGQRDGGYDVRIFTPAAEIDFAGHPTLGTAFVIREYLAGRDADEVVLNLRVGQVPVSFPKGASDEGQLWMRQAPPSFGDKMDPRALARVLSLPEESIDDRTPIEQVSTGLPFIIVPLKSLSNLKEARIDRVPYDELVAESWAKAVLVFAPEGYTKDQELSVRVFVDYYGVPEDPATGSGNGCLAAYLVKNRYFGAGSVDLKVGQGYEIGRPSTLALSAKDEEGAIEVRVGGRVTRIAEGWWG